MSKKLSKLEKSTSILADTKATQWCYVNTANEFKFMNRTFVIAESVNEYKVYNKPEETYLYTNEAYMDSVLVVMDMEDTLSFFNQDYDRIEKQYIEVQS